VSSKPREHALSIFFGAIFLLALIGQSLAGLAVFNEEQTSHGSSAVSYFEFVTSSAFVVDVAENWQSEYLQFFLFILATIWLVQKGSPESKKPGDEGIDSDESQLVGRFAKENSPRWAKVEGWQRVLYSNSLLLVMGAIFVFSWLVQSLAGVVVYNDDQLQHGEATVSWFGYVASADFWNRTLQNWQSEFLAVGSMVAFSIYLRQRGSSESKPVGTPHHETATEGE
jgi:membrane protein implicated in regulation of membrane protease activity